MGIKKKFPRTLIANQKVFFYFIKKPDILFPDMLFLEMLFRN